MYLTKIAIVFGIILIAVGVLGFVPAVTPNGLLLGIFEVDKMHNFVHLSTGIIALIAASKTSYAKLFFQVFGVVYAAITVAGFVRSGDLWMMHVNMADNYLHLVIAVIALYFGFVVKAATDE
jgi:hypothetical protein